MWARPFRSIPLNGRIPEPQQTSGFVRTSAQILPLQRGFFSSSSSSSSELRQRSSLWGCAAAAGAVAGVTLRQFRASAQQPQHEDGEDASTLPVELTAAELDQLRQNDFSSALLPAAPERHRLLADLFRSALIAADPYQAVRRSFSVGQTNLDGSQSSDSSCLRLRTTSDDTQGELRLDRDSIGRVVVVGAGKASLPMVVGVLDALGELGIQVAEGRAISRASGAEGTNPVKAGPVVVSEAGHPVVDCELTRRTISVHSSFVEQTVINGTCVSAGSTRVT